MRVKTFRGKNTSEVLRAVKRELGEDAIILSNKTVREGGHTICEVMAAVETAGNAAPASASQAQDSPNTPDWYREWSEIKGLILGLAGDKMKMGSLTPRQRQAMDYLKQDGVNTKVLMFLYNSLRRSRGTSVLGALGELVKTTPLCSRAWNYQIHALAGPSGSGKTSALIRMALNYKRQNPHAKVCLVSADDMQGKGRLVLKHYAQLSRTTFREIFGPDDFRLLMEDCGHYDRIFIDLPSLARGEKLDAVLGRIGLGGKRDMAVHLTLPPHYAQPQYDAFLKAYLTSKTTGLIWTKLDEACTYGAIVNVCEASGLPITALAYGPGLRDWCANFEKLDIWKLIFKHELPVSVAAARKAA